MQALLRWNKEKRDGFGYSHRVALETVIEAAAKVIYDRTQTHLSNSNLTYQFDNNSFGEEAGLGICNECVRNRLAVRALFPI